MSDEREKRKEKKEPTEYFASGGWLPTNKWAWISLAVFIAICVVFEYMGVL